MSGVKTKIEKKIRNTCVIRKKAVPLQRKNE